LLLLLVSGSPQITENFSYLPFGGGRRKCIGDQFALFEALVALAVLLRRYDFSLAPGKPEVGMTTGEQQGGEVVSRRQQGVACCSTLGPCSRRQQWLGAMRHEYNRWLAGQVCLQWDGCRPLKGLAPVWDQQ
jgi:hypothetical protein